MAKARQTKHGNGFINGLISDGNEFSAPDNAVRDMLNVEVLDDGSLLRRRGISFDDSPSVWADVLFSGTQQFHVSTHDWHNVQGLSDANYSVVIYGQQAMFYKKGVFRDLSNSFVNYALLNKGLSPGTIPGSGIPAGYTLATNEGYLIATAVNYYPQLLTSPTDTVQSFEPKIRDLEGVDDSYAVDYNPSVARWNFSLVSFAIGEVLTGATSGKKALVVGVGAGTSRYLLHLEPGGFINGEAVNGDGGGNGVITVRIDGDGLTEEHYYNLLNQGWDYERIAAYATSTQTYPSNAQIWYVGKDSLGDFDPPTLDKIDFGNSPAPRGKFIISAIDPVREFVDPLNGGTVTLPGVTPAGSFQFCTFFSGRLVLAGGNNPALSNKVYIGQLLTSGETDVTAATFQLDRFYSVNDVTAEELNDTLPTDGLTLSVAGLEQITGIRVLGKGLLITATNGLWFLRGNDLGFTAQDFELVKISNQSFRYPRSTVEAEDTIMLWGASGIYQVSVDATGLSATAREVTKGRINDIYTAYTEETKFSASGYYDAEENRVYWAYSENEDWGASISASVKHFFRKRMWCYNLSTGAFIPYNFLDGSEVLGTNYYLAGFSRDPFLPETETDTSLKIAVLRVGGVPNNGTTWARLDNRDFYDWGDVEADYPSYVETWPEHVGEPHIDKQIEALFCYFKRTETQFVDNGSGGVEFDYPSGVLMSSKWEWTDIDVGRWTDPIQVYRFNELYISGGIGDSFDYGFSVIKTKNDVSGKGGAVVIRLEAEAGKDMHFLGYSAIFSGIPES